MKKHITFNRILHKDKLMMIVSLILAIALWAWSDYEQDTLHDMTISEVPVNVSLSRIAREEVGLKIVEGADVKATVKVIGTRKDLRELRENSIHIEARTQDIIDEEDCKEPVLLDVELPASVSGKCQIEDVSGTNIFSKNGRYYLEIKGKVFSSEDFTLTPDQVETPNLSVANRDTMRFGTPEITGLADSNKNVTVYGWQEDVKKIKSVGAVVSADDTLSKIGRFTAKLVAYDKDGEPVENITFKNPANGEVGVIVPVIVYRKETLSVTVAPDAPAALVDKLVIEPLELGELPEKKVLDKYFDEIHQRLTVDFDHWLAEENKSIVQTLVTLKEKDDIVQEDGVYLDRAPNQITVTLDVEGYSNKTVKITLGDNVKIYCAEGYTAQLQSESIEVTICGPKAELDEISAEDITFVIDAKEQAENGHKVNVRPVVPDDMWVYYAADDAYEIEYKIVKE